MSYCCRRTHSKIPEELFEDFKNLVCDILAQQKEDAYGPVDVYLAVYLAALETQTQEAGRLPEQKKSEFDDVHDLISILSDCRMLEDI